MAGAVAATTLTRIWIATQATMPKGPDAIGPWAAAFQLAGAHPSIDMYDLPPYSVGMGLVLAPLVAVVRDPSLRFQIAVGGLSVLVLGAAWCTLGFLRRLGDVSRLAGSVAFATVAMSTTVAYSSAWTWAESLALLWMCGWLAAAAWALARRGAIRVAIVGVLAGTGPLVHGRFMGIALVWVASVVAVAIAGRRDVRAAVREHLPEVISAGLAATVSFVLSSWLRQHVIGLAWSKATYSTDTDFVASLDEPLYWWGVGKAVVGQLWYVVASTAGLAPLGAWGLLHRLRSGRATPAQRTLALSTSLAFASVFLTSVLWHGTYLMVPPPVRPDYVITGRYIDSALVPLAALGAVVAIDAARRRSRWVLVGSVVSVGALGALVTLIRQTSGSSPSPVLDAAVAGVASWPFDRAGHLDIVPWSALGIAATSAIALARFGGRVVTAGAVCAFLAFGMVVGSVAAARSQSDFDNSALYEGYPAAPERLEGVATAADALAQDDYRFNSPSQQYALADRGWQFAVERESSERLSAHPPSDAGMLVLTWDAPSPAGAWCAMPPFGSVRIWARVDLVAPATPAGTCELSP